MQYKFRCQNIIFFTPINSAIVARRCIHTQARDYIRVLAFGLPRAHVHGLCVCVTDFATFRQTAD